MIGRGELGHHQVSISVGQDLRPHCTSFLCLDGPLRTLASWLTDIRDSGVSGPSVSSHLVQTGYPAGAQ